MKELIPVSIKGATHLEIHIYYTKGRMNYFSYKEEPRGYYVSVTPVTVEEHFTSFAGFSGIKQFLNACGRKSDKEYQNALKRFTPEVKQFLIDSVLSKQNKKNDLNAISKELGISIPPRFEGMSKQEIEALPVHVVGLPGNPTYPNLAAVPKEILKKLCGPFGCEARDHLRFETQEAFKALSE